MNPDNEQAFDTATLTKDNQHIMTNSLTSNLPPTNMSSSLTTTFDHANTRLRLNEIFLKNLTLIELKYLKQICFNKLQMIFESSSYLVSATSASALASRNLDQTLTASYVRLSSIPKDESMKTVKTKNIAHHRSKSVDFKFFDELKENYFFKKKDSKDLSEQVFGQSLYKCILNDIKQSSLLKKQQQHETSNTNASVKSKNPSTSFAHNSLNLRWKTRNRTNLVIASKFDLNLLNNFDILTNNQLNAIQK